MKTIKFSESELEFLQSHYELELLDAENYVGEIKNILKKLGVVDKDIVKEKPVKKSGKKLGRPKKEKKAVEEKPAKYAPKIIKAAEEVKAQKEPDTKKASEKRSVKAVKPLKKVAKSKVAKTSPANPALSFIADQKEKKS